MKKRASIFGDFSGKSKNVYKGESDEYSKAKKVQAIQNIDVDKMNYEELLALEEKMGKVNIGLKEKDIDIVNY